MVECGGICEREGEKGRKVKGRVDVEEGVRKDVE